MCVKLNVTTSKKQEHAAERAIQQYHGVYRVCFLNSLVHCWHRNTFHRAAA
jgi:hypothetical protein